MYNKIFKICIYAICKNEEKFVDRWLNSLNEADYIVVLDTGSTDGTYEKLKADPRVTRVEQKIINPWRFDTARNESMKLIPEDTDICVSADLDDVFQPGWSQILKEDIEQNYTKIIGTYDYYDGEILTSSTTLDRVSLYNQAWWEGALHERLCCFNSHVLNDPRFRIEHRQDLNKPRRELYWQTAKDAIQEGDPYSILCFAYECYNMNNWVESIEYFTQLDTIIPTSSEYRTRKWAKLVSEMYSSLGYSDKSIEWLQKALSIQNIDSPFEDYFLYDGRLEEELEKLKLKISVCTICKNELYHLDNWIKPLLSADYIMILDTGSNDGTYERLLELANQYSNLMVTQKIYEEFSFADARNEAISRLKRLVNPENTNIVLCLDLDEYASSNLLESVRQEYTNDYQAIDIYCQNVDMYTTKGYLLTDNLYWRYDVHEEASLTDCVKHILQEGFYNHYQDLTKNRNYYQQLQKAYLKDPTCIHYLTYLIWEAQLHNDLVDLKKYCEEALNQIISNKNDPHYLDWPYFIYAGLVYIENYEIKESIYKELLKVLNEQEATFKSYYLFKSRLCEKLTDYVGLTENLIKSFLTSRSNNWVETNFNQSNADICTQLMLVYYYKLQDFEKAYLWANQAVTLEESTLTLTNLKLCETAFKEKLNV